MKPLLPLTGIRLVFTAIMLVLLLHNGYFVYTGEFAYSILVYTLYFIIFCLLLAIAYALQGGKVD